MGQNPSILVNTNEHFKNTTLDSRSHNDTLGFDPHPKQNRSQMQKVERTTNIPQVRSQKNKASKTSENM